MELGRKVVRWVHKYKYFKVKNGSDEKPVLLKTVQVSLGEIQEVAFSLKWTGDIIHESNLL